MSDILSELAQKALLTQEKLAPEASTKKPLHIAILKENTPVESRVALVPQGINQLVSAEHRIQVEKNAGLAASFLDTQFGLSGAKTANRSEALSSEILIKIDPFETEELSELSPEKIIISMIPVSKTPKKYFETLIQNRHIGIGLELIQDISGRLPILKAMSEIAGKTILQIAANFLHDRRIIGGITGIPPTNVVFIGSGSMVEHAAAQAQLLGANITIFDTDLSKLQKLKAKVPAINNLMLIDKENFERSLCEADLVIGAKRDDFQVSETQVKKMKPGTLIMDLSIDHGKCFETSSPTTLAQPTFEKHGIIHYCVPNTPAWVSNTASSALSQIITPILLKAGNVGGIEELIFSGHPLSKAVYCHKGSITNRDIAKKHGFRYKDLELLMAARF